MSATVVKRDTGGWDAGLMAAAMNVPTVPSSDLAFTLMNADLQHRCQQMAMRIDQMKARQMELAARDPTPQTAVAHTARQVKETMDRLLELQKIAGPFVAAAQNASKSDDTADDICRRYYMRFGGQPQQSLQHVCTPVTSVLALQSYARKIARNMASGAPTTALPTQTKTRSKSAMPSDSQEAPKMRTLRAKGTDRWCHRCQKARSIDEATNTYVCRECGSSVEFLDNDTKNFSFNKHYQLTKPLGYEHVNHFRKLLMHIQAKERTVVEKTVIDDLKREFSNGMQLPNNGHITIQTIKGKLRSLGRSDLYPYAPQIELILTGRLPLSLTVQQERLLIKMFHQHRQAFDVYKQRQQQRTLDVVGKKKGPRSNLLYYNYLLGKFAEILEEREHKRLNTDDPNIWTRVRERVNRLKSIACVQDHDNIHRDVCKILDWPFKPSSVGTRGNRGDLSKLARQNNGGEGEKLSLSFLIGGLKPVVADAMDEDDDEEDEEEDEDVVMDDD